MTRDRTAAFHALDDQDRFPRPAIERQTLSPELAADLKSWRLRAGYSQRSLAKALGASGSGYVCNLEKGRRAPSYGRAVALAQVLRLKPAEKLRLFQAAALTQQISRGDR